MRLDFFTILKIRNFRLIWTGCLFSDLGTWMQISALAIFITESTSSARWTGIASTATYLTVGLFTPICGVFADHYDKRKLIILSSLIQMIVGSILVIFFAMSWHYPILLVTLAGIQGIAGAAIPPAISSITPSIVSKNKLTYAALLEAISWNLGRALGPIIAVVVVGLQSYTAVFIINTLSYGIIALALYFVKTRPPTNDVTKQQLTLETTFLNLKVGWQELKTNSICKTVTFIAVIEMLCIAPFIALIPVMGQITLNLKSDASGLLFLFQGLGSAAGAFITGLLIHRFGVGKSFVTALLFLPFLSVSYALSPSLIFALLVIFPLSAAHTIILAIAISFILKFSDNQFVGRVIGIHRSMTITSYAVASSLLAISCNQFGLRQTLTCTSLLSVLIVILFSIKNRKDTVEIFSITNHQSTESTF